MAAGVMNTNMAHRQNEINSHYRPDTELTQIKRHPGKEAEGRQIGSLTHGKKTPAIGVK